MKMKFIKSALLGSIAFLFMGCDEGAPKTETLSVGGFSSLSVSLPLDDISMVNLDSYLVSGNCSFADGDVSIYLANVAATAECSSMGIFTKLVDLTAIEDVEEFSFYIQQNTNEYRVSIENLPSLNLSVLVSAPTIEDRDDYVTEGTFTVSFQCSEVGEQVHFSGVGLYPSIQTHTCDSTLIDQHKILTLEPYIETDQNNLIVVQSIDSSGNLAALDTSFFLPIDCKKPSLDITPGLDIRVGQVAVFKVEVEDMNVDFNSVDLFVSSGWVSSKVCIGTDFCILTSHEPRMPQM